jgi:hypothetical protein
LLSEVAAMRSSGGKSLDGLISRWGKFTALPVKLVEMIPEIGEDAFTLACVLFYHVNHDRNEEVSWPGYDRLGEMTGLRNQRISDALKKLEGAKLLVRRKRFGASTIYILTHPDQQSAAKAEVEAGKIANSPHVRRTTLPTGGGQDSDRAETNVDELNTNEYEEEASSSLSLVKELKTICPSGKITQTIIQKLQGKGISPERVALYREDEAGLAKFKKAHPNGDHPYLWPKQIYDEMAAFESSEEKSERFEREHRAQFQVLLG